jgi:hypothetical protein
MSDSAQQTQAGQGATEPGSDTAVQSGAEPEAGKGASPEPVVDGKGSAPAVPPKGDDGKDQPGDQGDEAGKGKEKGTGDEPAVPESYDLKLPENALLDAKALEGATEFAKELGLSNEQAQKLLERDNATVQSFVEATQVKQQEQVQAWEEELSADKEFGGDHLDESLEHAKSVLKRFDDADQGLLELLNSNGYGSNPRVVKVLARIGKAMAGDQLLTGNAPSGGPKTFEKRLYGDKYQS